jgi:DNA-binding XRE family transcriptional regulator
VPQLLARELLTDALIKMMLRIVCGTIVCVLGLLSIAMGSEYGQQFGRRVKTLRENCALSQEGLAESAGLHRTHISLIERGQRSVRLETIVRLAVALHVQPAELMPRVRLRG